MLKSIVIFTLSGLISALAHASPELERCAVYLQATTPEAATELERLDAVEKENSEVFRLLQSFRRNHLDQFEPEVSDKSPANGSAPSQELADRLFTIAHRDGFKLGKQDVGENGFRALLTRVQAKREVGAARILEVLSQRKQWLNGVHSNSPAPGVVDRLFQRQLVDESTLENTLSSLQPGRWFYHSFDLVAPAEVAEELWRMHGNSASSTAAVVKDAQSSFFKSLTTSLTGFLGRRPAVPNDDNVVIRVDELMMSDKNTSEPILVTVIRLSEDTTSRSRPGGNGRQRDEIEEVYDLAAELGLQPVPVIAHQPRRP